MDTLYIFSLNRIPLTHQFANLVFLNKPQIIPLFMHLTSVNINYSIMAQYGC